MPAINSSPKESNCSKCMTELEAEALKCSRCSVLMHLRCSDLPLYMLLRYKTSQSQYVCRACVLGEGNADSLKEEETKILEIMKNEEEAIKGATDNANCSVLGHTNTQCGDGDHQSDEMSKDINTIKANDRTGKVNTQAKDVSSNKTVCRYFLRQECRHGVSGKDCKFDHPKLCYKFIRNGSKHGGCK